jgi:hypothetical protein
MKRKGGATMVGPKELRELKRRIEETLVAMGRDDVGVGEVSEPREGVLGVTFSRGSHTHTAEVPLNELQNSQQARITVTRAILHLSKEIEQETMATAEWVVKD